MRHSAGVYGGRERNRQRSHTILADENDAELVVEAGQLASAAAYLHRDVQSRRTLDDPPRGRRGEASREGDRLAGIDDAQRTHLNRERWACSCYLRASLAASPWVPCMDCSALRS